MGYASASTIILHIVLFARINHKITCQIFIAEFVQYFPFPFPMEYDMMQKTHLSLRASAHTGVAIS